MQYTSKANMQWLGKSSVSIVEEICQLIMLDLLVYKTLQYNGRLPHTDVTHAPTIPSALLPLQLGVAHVLVSAVLIY